MKQTITSMVVPCFSQQPRWSLFVLGGKQSQLAPTGKVYDVAAGAQGGSTLMWVYVGVYLGHRVAQRPEPFERVLSQFLSDSDSFCEESCCLRGHSFHPTAT